MKPAWCMRFFLFFFIVFSIGFLPASEPMAADDHLDEIMGGFDDDAPASGVSEKTSHEDILDGFDDDVSSAATEDDEETKTVPVSPWSLSGHAKLAASVNIAHDAPQNDETDWRGLSRLRSELLLEANYRPEGSFQAFASAKGFFDAAYSIKGRDDFTNDVLSEYENELELREAWLLFSPVSSLDVKIGRQIVVWGKSDTLRVIDVLNPLDMREPGLTDIEDLRLPVAMTRLDYYFGDMSITAVAVHEIRFDKQPAFGHDFFPSATPMPEERIPGDNGRNTEFALALNGVFSGWDFSLVAAHVFDDAAHVVRTAAGKPALEHARLNMIGATTNIAFGNFLFKAEAAWFDGFTFFHVPGKTFQRMDVLAGVDYSGFSDTTISLEVVNRHLFSHEKRLEQAPDQVEEDELQSVLRVERSFLNETLNLTLLMSLNGLGGDDGGFQRISTEYDITDALTITSGVVFYQSGDRKGFGNIGDNDRIYAELKYSF